VSPRRRLSEDLLSAYVDGELDEDTRAAVETRLARSASWRAVLEEIRGAKAAVRGLPAVDLPADAWDRLLARVAADELLAAPPPPPPGYAWPRTWRDRVRDRPVRWAAAMAGAAAAAVVVAAIVLPGPREVTPKVSAFSAEQQARASLAGDPVSSLAGVEMLHGMGR
jgi:anti-sigma factor RsiW